MTTGIEPQTIRTKRRLYDHWANALVELGNKSIMKRKESQCKIFLFAHAFKSYFKNNMFFTNLFPSSFILTVVCHIWVYTLFNRIANDKSSAHLHTRIHLLLVHPQTKFYYCFPFAWVQLLCVDEAFAMQIL